jgi:hypothetical protein
MNSTSSTDETVRMVVRSADYVSMKTALDFIHNYPDSVDSYFHNNPHAYILTTSQPSNEGDVKEIQAFFQDGRLVFELTAEQSEYSKRALETWLEIATRMVTNIADKRKRKRGM